MRRRVVITGMGAITPLAIGVEESWRALCAGKSGIGPVTFFDASPLKCQAAAEVKGFHPEDFMDKKLVRRMDRFNQFALAAARLAVADSGLKIDSSIQDRVGTVVGTAAVGASSAFETAHTLVMQGNYGQISPFFVPNVAANMAPALIGIQFQARGPQHCPMEACAAGTNALGLAFRFIQIGEADAFICGGADAGITPTMFAGLEATGALTRNRDHQKASRPFDARRDGMVAGEGVGIVVLEELGMALRRGARIYAEVVGWGHNADAYHFTSPSPGGEGPGQCMRLALADAQLSPQDIDYVNAHGTSTVANDVSETMAIKMAFGEHAKKLAVSSNKSMTGHMWGAAGAVEAIFSALTIRDGIIPPTINYEYPDPQCDLDYVPNVARKAQVKTALSNSFGFGGINGSLIIRAFQE